MSAEKSPEWLKVLEGKNSLLNTTQYNFIKQVFSQILQSVKIRKVVSEEDICELRKDAEILKRNFHQFVEQVKMSEPAKKRFIEVYPQWHDFRYRNIANLRDIARKVETHNKNCQKTKFMGYFVSFIGGAVALFSDIKTGGVMVGLGTGVSIGTSVIEEILLYKNINKIKEVMEQDKKCLKELIVVIRDGKGLHQALETMKSAKYAENLQRAAEKFYDISKMNMSKQALKGAIQEIIKTFVLPNLFSEEMAHVVGILLTVTMFITDYYSVFVNKFKSYNVNQSCELNQSFELTGGQIALGMGLNAVNMLLIALQDAKSIEVQEIEKVANQLESEICEFKTLYEDMISRNSDF